MCKSAVATYITAITCLGCDELINSVRICISKVTGFTFFLFWAPAPKGWVSFDVLLLGASRVRSERSRPLEGAPHSCMPLAGVFGEGASVVEDMTRLKRQWHCDASGLHLCTLSLLFRRSGSALLSRREAQSCCLQATVTWGLLPVVPAGCGEGTTLWGCRGFCPVMDCCSPCW